MVETKDKKRPKPEGVDPQTMPPDPLEDLEMPPDPPEKDVAKRERARDSTS